MARTGILMLPLSLLAGAAAALKAHKAAAASPCVPPSASVAGLTL